MVVEEAATGAAEEVVVISKAMVVAKVSHAYFPSMHVCAND